MNNLEHSQVRPIWIQVGIHTHLWVYRVSKDRNSLHFLFLCNLSHICGQKLSKYKISHKYRLNGRCQHILWNIGFCSLLSMWSMLLLRKWAKKSKQKLSNYCLASCLFYYYNDLQFLTQICEIYKVFAVIYCLDVYLYFYLKVISHLYGILNIFKSSMQFHFK